MSSVFTVREGLLTPSIMQKIHNDARTIRTGLMACKIVQIVSTSCASVVLVCVNLLVTISEII